MRFGAIASGPPAAVNELVTMFAAGDETTAVTRFAAGDGGFALRTGVPPGVVVHLQRTRARVLPQLPLAHGRIYDRSTDNRINNSDTFHIVAKRVTVDGGQG